jgi:hypothetical protein
MLKACGREHKWFILLVNSLDNWYAGAFRQLTTGLIGWSCFWIFISPLREGAEGFMFVYLHLLSFGIKVGLCFTVFQAWD